MRSFPRLSSSLPVSRGLVVFILILLAGIGSAAPGFARAYKRLINDGYDLPFGEAMQLEATRSTAANARVSAAEVEAARSAVQQRGRSQ
jgi:enoyl-CoA hydratase